MQDTRNWPETGDGPAYEHSWRGKETEQWRKYGVFNDYLLQGVVSVARADNGRSLSVSKVDDLDIPSGGKSTTTKSRARWDAVRGQDVRRNIRKGTKKRIKRIQRDGHRKRGFVVGDHKAGERASTINTQPGNRFHEVWGNPANSRAMRGLGAPRAPERIKNVEYGYSGESGIQSTPYSLFNCGRGWPASSCRLWPWVRR